MFLPSTETLLILSFDVLGLPHDVVQNYRLDNRSAQKGLDVQLKQQLADSCDLLTLVEASDHLQSFKRFLQSLFIG